MHSGAKSKSFDPIHGSLARERSEPRNKEGKPKEKWSGVRHESHDTLTPDRWREKKYKLIAHASGSGPAAITSIARLVGYPGRQILRKQTGRANQPTTNQTGAARPRITMLQPHRRNDGVLTRFRGSGRFLVNGNGQSSAKNGSLALMDQQSAKARGLFRVRVGEKERTKKKDKENTAGWHGFHS